LVILNESNLCIRSLAESGSVLGNSVQYRLNVGRRASDNTQDFACRRLLFQRLIEFLEESDVLDCDNCLIGERFEELDLNRTERAYLHAACVQCANEFPLLTKGND